MHAMQRCQLADRLVSLDRRQRHLGLEPSRMGLPFLRHDDPFLGQPTVAYSTVQFLGSTSPFRSPVFIIVTSGQIKSDRLSKVKIAAVCSVVWRKLLLSLSVYNPKAGCPCRPANLHT